MPSLHTSRIIAGLLPKLYFFQILLILISFCRDICSHSCAASRNGAQKCCISLKMSMSLPLHIQYMICYVCLPALLGDILLFSAAVSSPETQCHCFFRRMMSVSSFVKVLYPDSKYVYVHLSVITLGQRLVLLLQL